MPSLTYSLVNVAASFLEDSGNVFQYLGLETLQQGNFGRLISN